MAEFDVTLSAVSEAATNIANYTETFREEADATYRRPRPSAKAGRATLPKPLWKTWSSSISG